MRGVDQRVLDLARVFIEDTYLDRDTHGQLLAEHIQDAIEDWLEDWTNPRNLLTVIDGRAVRPDGSEAGE